MYYFKPMMPLYSKLLSCPTEFLMHKDGRKLIAKTIKHCRKHHGLKEARSYYNALIVLGVIYPQLWDVVKCRLIDKCDTSL